MVLWFYSTQICVQCLILLVIFFSPFGFQPIISTLNSLVRTGDEIVRIEGIFSGTMSFLFNSFSSPSGPSNQPFSQYVIRILCTIEYIWHLPCNIRLYIPNHLTLSFSLSRSLIRSLFITVTALYRCVKEAKDKGYTEPDPRDDLNGTNESNTYITLYITVSISEYWLICLF